MGIIGIGIDAIELSEIEEMLTSYGEHFLASFTPAEVEYAGSGVHRLERLAGRYAAKEAVAKALGTGWGDGVDWPDIEVLRSSSGAPTVELHNQILEIAQARGVAEWFLTVTHTSRVAIAVAIATR